MKKSDILKERSSNRGIKCSGNKKCSYCKLTLKKNKRNFSKASRRFLKKQLISEMKEVI